MRKSFTAGVLVLGMAIGSMLTMALNPIGAASALVSGSSTSGHQSILQEALDTLVGKGTITQSQANAVEQQVQSDRQAFIATRPVLGPKVLDEIAATLKMTPKDLRVALRGGKSIAQVAQAHGVSPTTLANDIVSGFNKIVSARVAAHKLSQADATTMQQNLPARVNAMLNRVWGLHRHHEAPSSTGSTTTTTH
jgi:hypothetical protein